MSERTRYKKRQNSAEHNTARTLDDLAEYEKFKKELLPALRKDILAGMSAKEILDKYQAHAAATLVSASALAPVTSDRTAAAKYVVDQAAGKAKESKEITHRLKDLSDEQIDSLLLSQLKEVDVDEERKN